MVKNGSDYIELQLNGGQALVRKRSVDRLRVVDSFAFDCDGTLVDTEGSFTRATFETVERLLENMHGKRLAPGSASRHILTKLRQTGEYNNDWDSVFAIVCFISAAYAELGSKGHPVCTGELLERAAEMVNVFTLSTGSKGVENAKEYTRSLYAGIGMDREYSRIMSYLNYPNLPSLSPLSSIYQMLYLGRGENGSMWPDRTPEGLASSERPLVSAETIRQLMSISGGRKPAIITGAGGGTSRQHLATSRTSSILRARCS